VTQERLFHAVGAILVSILVAALYYGREWGVILIWSLVEALRNG
jgi:hypothetical protein